MEPTLHGSSARRRGGRGAWTCRYSPPLPEAAELVLSTMRLGRWLMAACLTGLCADQTTGRDRPAPAVPVRRWSARPELSDTGSLLRAPNHAVRLLNILFAHTRDAAQPLPLPPRALAAFRKRAARRCAPRAFLRRQLAVVSGEFEDSIYNNKPRLELDSALGLALPLRPPLKWGRLW